MQICATQSVNCLFQFPLNAPIFTLLLASSLFYGCKHPPAGRTTKNWTAPCLSSSWDGFPRAKPPILPIEWMRRQGKASPGTPDLPIRNCFRIRKNTSHFAAFQQMPPTSPPTPPYELAVFQQQQKEKKCKKGRWRSKSPAGLICCCRLVRRPEKLSTPVYTARELSVASLGLQPLALLGASQQRPLAKGPPHQSAQMAIVAVQSQDAFADDTPNNLADYLDCGVQTGEEELMETARTSRLEDLKEYPSMEELVDEIVSEYGDAASSSTRTSLSTKYSSAQESRKDGQLSKNQPNRLAKSQSQRMPALSPFTVSSPASLCPSLEGAGATASPCWAMASSDPERQPTTAVALYQQQPPALRLAVAALPQAMFELCWLGYVWVASSLAFLLSWLF